MRGSDVTIVRRDAAFDRKPSRVHRQRFSSEKTERRSDTASGGGIQKPVCFHRPAPTMSCET
ncbi:MAG: hypothetical protein PHD38_08935, partial [Mesotoga sp.]|nr:hypothetical protein [Mesotoga sp.]